MNMRIKVIIAIAGVCLLTLSPAVAHAEREYFLVGVRHVYEIGPDRDKNLSEREEIEKNYADGVAEDQDTFNQHVANGADHEKESDLLNQDLDALADARDKSLGSLFVCRDDLRDRHPELKIQGDGPYQVIGIEMHETGNSEVFDSFCAYAPWPGYVVVDGCYGGWQYGVWYDPGIFFGLYWDWWGVFGGFRFCPGFCGHFGRVDFAPHGFIDHSRFAGSGHGFGRSTNRIGAGYSHSASGAGRGWGSSSRSVSGYSHASMAGQRSSGYARSSGSTGYSHSGSSIGAAHSAASTGYTHSPSRGFSRSGGSVGSSRSAGYSGYSHASNASSGAGWSGHSRSSSGASYSRSHGSSSTQGIRSGGFSRSSSGSMGGRGGSPGWSSSRGGSSAPASGGRSFGSGRLGGGSGGHGRSR